MARIAFGAIFGLVVGVVAGAALSIHAAQEDDAVALAHQVGIDPGDLADALAAQPGVDAVSYLRFEGLLAQPASGVGTGAGSPPASGQIDCIIAKESGGLDVLNRHGTGATGPGQYMPATWRAHTAEMGMPWLNIHSLGDVRRVMAYDLAMGRRSQWTVSGC